MKESSKKALTGTVTSAVIFAAVVVFFGGCVTTSAGKKEFDSCRALSIAASSQQVAESGAELVCSLLPKEKQADCYKYKKQASVGTSAVIGLAATVLKACGLGGN